MRKFNYLVLLCCLFITQGIFAQNMHRAVTLNAYTGVESGSEYLIYSVAGNMVAKGRINLEEIVSYDYLQSGMYIIAVTNNGTLLKTFKFIRL